MKITSESYDSVCSVNHQGYVLSFVTRRHVDGVQQADYDDILYNVLDVASVGETEQGRESVRSSSSDPSAAWSPYVLLEFPSEVAPAAMRVLAAPVPGLETTAAATRPGAPICALSVGDEIFVFRQTKASTNDTLYIDRFHFDEKRMGLVPVRESRFTRSQLADIPASDRDSLDLRGPDGQAFTAATVALTLDGPISAGFAVVLVPSSDDSGISYWHLFVGRDGEVFVYRVRHSAYSPFDLRVDEGPPVALDPRDDACHQITPITSWGLNGYVLSQPAAAIYAQQEEFVDPKGDSVSLLKGGRAMVTAVARTHADADAETGVVAVVDFAIGADGQLARLGHRLDNLPSLPLGVALSFDGRNDRVLSAGSYSGYANWYAQAWVRWRDIEAGSLRCVLTINDTAGPHDVSLSIDSDGKLVVEGHNSAGQPTVWRTVRCVPRRRWTLVGVMAKAGYPPLCYVNNHPVMFEQGERGEVLKPVVFMVWAGRLPNDSKGSALPFCGEMSDLRLYNAAASNVQGEELLDLDTAFQDGNLILHWSLAEGAGTTIPGGKITGAQWVAAGPPSQRSMEVLARDSRLLDVRGGLLTGVETAAAPSLVTASDGRLRLYYQRSDDHLGVAQLSTEVARAQEVLYWTRDSDGGAALDVALVLTSQLTGSGMNESPASSFGPVSTDGLSFTTIELYSQLPGCAGVSAVRETWRDVPRDLAALCEVLNGGAVQPDGNIGASVEQSHGQVVYDYANKVTLSIQSEGGAWEDRALTIEAGASYPSSLFHASGLDARRNSKSATIPAAENCRRFPIAGCDSAWLMNPIQPTLYLSDESGRCSYARIHAADQLSIAGDLTLEAWLLPQKKQTSTILSYVDERSGYQLGYDAKWRPYAVRRGQNGTPTLLQRARVPLANSWSHLAASYSSSYGLELRDGIYVDCGGGKDMGLRDALTVEAWIRPSVLPGPGEEQVVVSRWDEDRLDRGFMLSITDERVRFQVGTDDPQADAGGSVRLQTLSHRLEAGRWTHLTAVYSQARAMNMLAFSPTDENYLDVGPLTKAPLSNCTVEMWVAPDVWNGEARVLFEANYRPSSDPSSTSVTALRLEYSPTTKVSSYTFMRVIINGDHAAHTMQVSLPNLSPSDPGYHHLAVTTRLVGERLYVSVYFDGKNIQTEYFTELFPADALSDRWVFGASLVDRTARDFYAGAMRDLRVWSVARSSAAILDGMTRRLHGDEHGLIGYWPLSQAPGSGPAVTNLVDRSQQLVHRRVPEEAGDPSGQVNWMEREIGGGISLMIDTNTAIFSANSAGAPRKTDAPLLIGAAASGAGLSTFTGAVDDVRIWRSARSSAQLQYFQKHALIDAGNDERIAAAWAMDEGRGTLLADTKKGSPGTITAMNFTATAGADDLWIPTSFGGAWTLYVNGQPVELESVELPSEGELGFTGLAERAPGLTLGSPALDVTLTGVDGDPLKLRALVAELRIWDRCRRPAEIAEDYDRPLRGDEPQLGGYWPLRDGSGTALEDRSPYHLIGELIAGGTIDPNSYWLEGAPPFTQEDPRVVDVGNAHISAEAFAVHLSAPPSVAEYFADGRARRAYLYIAGPNGDESDSIELTAGRSVGALELAYLGQLQYDPQLVGYIEGPPPVPSENLTVDAASNPDRYVGTASVSLDNVSASGKDSSHTWNLDLGLRGYFEGGVAVSGLASAQELVVLGIAEGLLLYLIEGTALGAQQQVFNLSGNALGYGDAKIEGGGGAESSSGSQVERSTQDTVVLAGGWENNVYNIPWASAEQRFIQAPRFYRPNNMAAALVRSKTADLFAVRSKETGAVLGYKLEPAQGGKRDDNIIMFKLNPRYVKNGTLDGNIGYDRDIDYAEPSAEASYLRPAEAYRMQANAARQRVDGKDASELDFANSYVWTADGGLHQAETKHSAQRKEVYNGALMLGGSLGFKAGLEVEVGLGVLFGIKGALDLAGNLQLNFKWQNTKSASSQIELSSTVEGEGFLSKIADTRSVTVAADPSRYAEWVSELDRGELPASLGAELEAQTGVEPTTRVMVTVIEPGSRWTLIDVLVRYQISGDVARSTLTLTPPQKADPGQYPVLYASELCPGKVRDYRFSTIYQHPRTANFDRLFGDAAGQDEPIIDPQWLASADPDAVALRQARHRRKDVWRVLHRVTYVSRVPLDASVKTEADSPPSGSSAPEQVSNRQLRPDDYSMVANARTIAAGLYGINPNAPDYARMSVNVDSLLVTLGLGASALQRQYYHDLVMVYLEALLAEGTLSAPV